MTGLSAGAVWAVLGLGVFHGLNPGMGWLFAVALGLQERAAGPVSGPAAPATATGGTAVALARRPAGRSRVAVLRALPPIALGHLASVAMIAAAFMVTESVVASRWVTVAGGLLLVGLGLWRLLARRHFRWVGMRLSAWELGTWSFLMSSVHGAGLMLVPVFAHHGGAGPVTAAGSVPLAVASSALHTGAMLVTMGVVALLVIEVLGLAVLRRAWVNVDQVWAIALVAAGLATLLTA